MCHTRYLIMAGGQEVRWRNYLGTHKHLIEINGERLLDRTIRLLHDRSVRDIITVAKHAEYDIDSVRRAAPLDLENGAVVASQDYWSIDSRTTVLFGDVFFTEDAMDQICKVSSSECTFIGRAKRSKITGCPYQELFGLSLLPENHQQVAQSIERVKFAMGNGEIRMCPGWSVYRHLQGIGLRNRRCPSNFLEINDFTEDFDTPEDYDRWIVRYTARNNPRQSKWKFWNRAA